jgi:hypothetical protein
MKKYTLRIFILHLAIALIYIIIGNILFYTGYIKGTVTLGIIFWMLAIVHFILTVLICSFQPVKNGPQKSVVIQVLINGGAVIFWTFMHLMSEYLIYW